MNDHHDPDTCRRTDLLNSAASDLAQQIDRLVGGDLNDQERRELLTWMDAEPLRWRRCAYAFLEAQVIREAFATIGSSDTEYDSAVSPNVSCAAPSKNRPHKIFLPSWRPAVNVAAAALVFGCGWLFGNRVTLSQAEVARQTTHESSVEKPGSDKSATGTADTPRPPTIPAPAPQVPTAGKPESKVIVTTRPPNCEFTLPMLGKDLPADHWARQSTVPKHIKNQWDSQGYQVSENRRFVPMQLADGRRVVVPINHVTLKFVGQHSL